MSKPKSVRKDVLHPLPRYGAKQDKIKPKEEVAQPVDEAVEEVVEEVVEETVEEPVEEEKVKYAFPNASQCPRCRTHDTIATSTKGKKQYRRCRRCIGGWNYCVTGIKEK